MCGILALLGNAPGVSEDIFDAALQTISHRGPDGEGVYRDNNVILGHKRLSILDLSEAGAQPYVDDASELVITYNGEIFNYLELRAELKAHGYSFRSNSDTEVLIKGYAHWGENVLKRLNGMWAFVIWDPKKRIAFMSRDRFGIKPFYYGLTNNSMIIASEPKAIHALAPELSEPNSDAIVDLIVYSQMHVGERTAYKRLKSLPAGHCAIYKPDSDEFSQRRYWDYPQSERKAIRAESAGEEFTEIFENAVKLRLRSDARLGLTLSGGLDSSSILAATNQFSADPITCYTSVYSDEERGEESWAAIAADYTGANLKSVMSPVEDWTSLQMKVTHHLDSPGQSPAVLPLWSIMKNARAQKRYVLLEGQGADELLGGYPRYIAAHSVASARRLDIHSASASLKGLFGMGQTPLFALGWLLRSVSPSTEGVFRKGRQDLFRDDVLDAWSSNVSSVDRAGLNHSYPPSFSALHKDHSKNILPGLLHYGDAISMAHGVESRLPFMDYKLVEWVFKTLPNLFFDGQPKAPVRDYLNFRGFDRIASRADKQGYPVPYANWYKAIGCEYITSLVNEPSARIWDYMDINNVKKIALSVDSVNLRNLFHLYKIFSTDIWLRCLTERQSFKGTK